MNAFIEALFEPNELVYAGHIKGVKPRPAAHVTAEFEFICINPLTGPRNQQHVGAYRNILVESDKLPVDAQLGAARDVGLPFTTAVHSGNKSIHFILRLDEPCSGADDYRMLVGRLYKWLNRQGFPVDGACKNPTRLSRNAGFLRETGRAQELIEVRAPVSRNTLELLVGPAPVLEPAVPNINGFRATPNAYTQITLEHTIPEGDRHRLMVLAALDLKRCGFSPDEVEALLLASPTAASSIHRFGAEISRIVSWAYTSAT